MANFARNVRFGLRLLVKNAGFTSVALLALILGIGANTAIFSVVYATLLSPMPYPNPDQLVIVWAKINANHFARGEGTIDFCLRMMSDAEVALAPGRAFGENGENCVRIALVENEHRLRQAMRNLDRALNPRLPRPRWRSSTPSRPRATPLRCRPRSISYAPPRSTARRT